MTEAQTGSDGPAGAPAGQAPTGTVPAAPARDRWEKASILFGALIPLSIALVGHLVSTRLERAEERAAASLSRSQIEATDSRARAERSVLLHQSILDRLPSISQELFDEGKDDSYKLGRRLAAMSQLAMIAQSQDPAPPDYYFNLSVGILTEYVRENAGRRLNASLPGVWPDTRPPEEARYRAVDILQALRTLQAIRRASAKDPRKRVEVRLTGIDFSRLSLADKPQLDLSGFDFSFSKFEYSYLSGCICADTIFDHASLRYAVIWTGPVSDFRRARFVQTDLTGSKWSNVDLSDSTFKDVRGRPAVWQDIVPAEKAALYR